MAGTPPPPLLVSEAKMTEDTTRLPRTPTAQRILRQDYRGNEVYTVTREDLTAIEAEAAGPVSTTRPTRTRYRLHRGGPRDLSAPCPHCGKLCVVEAKAVAPDAGLRARHSLPDGRLHDADTCPDENHAGDLHDLFAAHPAPQWVEACVDPGHHE